jgi:hypothetical protein
MSNHTTSPHASFADDSNATFLIRWRGRQEGPFTAAVIEAKLAANQIGLLHEISYNGQWVTLRDYLAEREAILRAEHLAHEEQERRAREEAERLAKEREEQRRVEALAEERRKAAQVEADNFRQQQAGTIHSFPSQPSGGSSGLRTVGILLLLGGLAVSAYFFLAFDTSVESGMGRINNLGLMADRQNGIILGIGLSVVGTIMLVIGARGKN